MCLYIYVLLSLYFNFQFKQLFSILIVVAYTADYQPPNVSHTQLLTRESYEDGTCLHQMEERHLPFL